MPTVEERIWENLKQVKDPEFGRSIIDRGLIDEVRVEGGKAHITYHLTVPFCPMVFAVHIGREIKKKAKVEGIDEVIVKVKGHNQTEEINRQLQ
ncbi:MAG: metal-sulfur cluster assembly factor [bacterium]